MQFLNVFIAACRGYESLLQLVLDYVKKIKLRLKKVTKTLGIMIFLIVHEEMDLFIAMSQIVMKIIIILLLILNH